MWWFALCHLLIRLVLPILLLRRPRFLLTGSSVLCTTTIVIRILVTRVCILKNVGRTLEMVEVEVVRVAIADVDAAVPRAEAPTLEQPEHTRLEPLGVQNNFGGTLGGSLAPM